MTFNLDYGDYQFQELGTTSSTSSQKDACKWITKLIPENFALRSAFNIVGDSGSEREELAEHHGLVSSLLVSEIERPYKDAAVEILNIVGITRDHYINYSKRGGRYWFLFDDHKCK
jgi:hypothetical protein